MVRINHRRFPGLFTRLALVGNLCLILAVTGLFPQQACAQDRKPKVALVLSGGGAKGIAHIPLLQALDSLGIVPDLIVGTSMGGVVGGLYAMGYSGDSIARIAESADWDYLLGGDVGLSEVAVEEKSEYGRYQVNFDVVGRSLRPTLALLNDQNLREYINNLTFPVRETEDFDRLPIPFRAVATDLLQGREMVLSQGSLSRAMRATMSIPSIFEPVEYDDALLVDGGVQNNFPVDVARNLGADIVIGSDVGGGLLPKEKLNSIGTILFQTSMMNSNVKNEANRAACDILVDHIPHLTYSTSDFARTATMYQEGTIGLKEKKHSLDSLAAVLKGYPQRRPALPPRPEFLVFDSIAYTGISEGNRSLVRARSGLSAGVAYRLEDIIGAEDRIMGTRRFHSVSYRLEQEGGASILHLNGTERAKNLFSGSIHFDTNRGVGVIANYTGRNLLTTADRLLLGLDVAEEPKFRMQYQLNFSENRNWWVRAEAFGEKFVQNYFYQGTKGEDLNNLYFKTNLEFNRNLHTFRDYVGIDLYYEYFRTRPRTGIEVSNNVYDLERYSMRNLEVSAHYSQNTQDRVFFATRGTLLGARFATSLSNQYDVAFNENTDLDFNGSLEGFSRFMFDLDQRWRLSPEATLIVGGSIGLTFFAQPSDGAPSYDAVGVGSYFFLGGNLRQPKRGSVPFPGLDDSELLVTQFIMANAALQLNPLKDIYLSPHFNLATVGFSDFEDFASKPFFPGGDWEGTGESSFLVSGGGTLSYDSLLGPVHLDMSFVNGEQRFRIFFSAGLMLNIPD